MFPIYGFDRFLPVNLLKPALGHKQTALINHSNAWDALLVEGNLVSRHLLEHRSYLFVSGDLGLSRRLTGRK